MAEAALNKKTMPFLSHLDELRRRLFISFIAVFLFSIIGYFFAPALIKWLADFYYGATSQSNAHLAQSSVLDGMLLRIKVATFIGLFLAFPVWMFELWRFVTPGLDKKEKRIVIPFILASIVLFIFGGIIALMTLTKALEFLLSAGGVQYFEVISATGYITFVLLMVLAFGISFEFPVFLIFLLLARIITTDQLKSFRRGAILIIVIFAAVITPSADPYSLFLMAIPMYVFYEISIVIGRILKR